MTRMRSGDRKIPQWQGGAARCRVAPSKTRALKRALLFAALLLLCAAPMAAQAQDPQPPGDQMPPDQSDDSSQSSDAALRALAGSTSTDGSTFGGSLTLKPVFTPATTSYTAWVPNAVTHVKLTPTVNESRARVKVGKGTSLQPVVSGRASSAIALGVGANAIRVEVTAHDGSTRQTYTVTVRRSIPPPTITEIVPDDTKLTVKFTVSPGTDYVDVQYRRKSPPGTWASRVTNQDHLKAGERTIDNLASGTTYQVRMSAYSNDLHGESEYSRITEATTRLQPPGIESLTATAGIGQIALSWGVASHAVVDAFDVNYTASTTVSLLAAASAADPSKGWVDANHRGTDTSHTLTGLGNGTTYRVRVRGRNRAGNGSWVIGRATSRAWTWSLTPAATVGEGQSAALVVTLSGAAPAAGVSFTVAYAFDGASPASPADFFDRPATFTVPAGQSSATLSVGAARDQAVESDETATVTLTPTGGSGAKTAALTVEDRTVVVNLSDVHVTEGDGRVNISVTASRKADFGFPVNVRVNQGPAMQGADFSSPDTIALTFPERQTSRSFTIDVLDDNAWEGTETFGVELVIPETAKAMGVVAGARGSARVHIIDNDPPPYLTGLAVVDGAGNRLDVTSNAPGLTGFDGRYVSQSADGPTIRFQVFVAAGMRTVTVTPHWEGAGMSVEVISKVPDGSGWTVLDSKTVTASGTPTGNLRVWDNTNGALLVVKAARSGPPYVYWVYVTPKRGAPSADAYMKALELEGLAGAGGDTGALEAPAFYSAGSSATASPGDGSIGTLTLEPAFDDETYAYRASVPHGVTAVVIRAVAHHAAARLTVNGAAPGRPLALAVGDNRLAVVVTAENGTTKTYTVTVTRAAPPPQPKPPLTAAFENVMPDHDGTAFALSVRFSEALGRDLVPASFAVKNGKVEAGSLRRLEPGLWGLRLMPDGWKGVDVTLKGGRDCGKKRAVCTADGRALASPVSVSVPGLRLRVADGKAREGRDAAIAFAVTLNRAAAHRVRVDYATADGTATAGADYIPVDGQLHFEPGETDKTVRVAILDDGIDEGKEKFFLRLSNPQGAFLRKMHREAKGVIVNDDPLQKTWLARFGRTVGTQALEAIADRFTDDGRASYLTLAGTRLGGALDPDPQAAEPARLDAMRRTPRDLLLGSSFRLAAGGDQGTALWSAWGRFASHSFDGVADDVTLSGEVTTGFLGADVSRGRWLAGLALGLSAGDGPFTLNVDAPTTRGQGTVESDLTAAFPYVRLALSERLDLWAVGGIGQGTMTITEDGGRPLEVGTRLHLGALGSRGVLVGGEGTGFELALKSDLLLVRMRSDGLSSASGTLAATSAGVSRLRLLLQGSRSIALGAGSILKPALELGVRHDGGDAETGSGVEAGVRLAWATTWGLTLEASLRGLLAHEAAGYEEWGASAALRFDPGRRGLGLTASLAPVWGAASSGAERLWGQQSAAGLLTPDASEPDRGRLEAELGYGLPALRGKGVLTPYVRSALMAGGEQAWQLGTRLALAEKLDLSLEASRRDGAADPDHAIALKAALGW